jgi:hypothetical protein
MTYDANELIEMARAAERDDRLSTGALYGKLADALEQEINNWKKRNNDACAAERRVALLRSMTLDALTFEELEAEYVRRAQRA